MTYEVTETVPFALQGRSVQLGDGAARWWRDVPADVPIDALIIDAPLTGSYGAGWAREIRSHNRTVRVFGELAAVWPANADEPAWLYQRSGHARTGDHSTALAWCPNHGGYVTGTRDDSQCLARGLCPEGRAAGDGLQAARKGGAVA